jgi:hypothetical protein
MPHTRCDEPAETVSVCQPTVVNISEALSCAVVLQVPAALVSIPEVWVFQKLLVTVALV